MTDLSSKLRRVTRLVEAARRLADPSDEIGRRARAILPASTGLSPKNVEIGLVECLETDPSPKELETLCLSVPDAPRVWVTLAPNVFVAPLRAIALALAQSANVRVRASRREPEFCRLLAETCDAFELADAIEPRSGDHVWLYGSDETLDVVTRGFEPGVIVHAHGSGIGIAIVSERDAARAAAALASDVVAFDQRGCLSPRLAFAIGDVAFARAFAAELAAALEHFERSVPLGALSADEAAEITRFRDTMRYAAELLPAGRGFVSLLDEKTRVFVPPVGRNVVVITSPSLPAPDPALVYNVAAVGIGESAEHDDWAKRTFPAARRSPLGHMQRPPLDGPVDLRPSSSGKIV